MSFTFSKNFPTGNPFRSDSEINLHLTELLSSKQRELCAHIVHRAYAFCPLRQACRLISVMTAVQMSTKEKQQKDAVVPR